MTIFGEQPPPGFTISLLMTVAQHTTAPASDVPSPSAGEYEVVTVSITGRSGSYPYAPNNFKFVIGSQPYPPIPAGVEGFGPPLGEGTLSAGQSVSGTVTFNVPSGGGHVGIFDESGTQICGWPVVN
jgi:hypothetical protein